MVSKLLTGWGLGLQVSHFRGNDLQLTLVCVAAIV